MYLVSVYIRFSGGTGDNDPLIQEIPLGTCFIFFLEFGCLWTVNYLEIIIAFVRVRSLD